MPWEDSAQHPEYPYARVWSRLTQARPRSHESRTNSALSIPSQIGYWF